MQTYRLTGSSGWRSSKRSGQALVEFTFSAVMLLLMVFGLVDFGRAIYVRQVLMGVSREAANLASRATTLTNTLSAAYVSANVLNLQQNGYVILTVVSRDQNGNATITDRLAGGGSPTTSKVGASIGAPAILPVTAVQVPPPGRSLYVAEISATFQPVTPIGKLLKFTLPSRLSDAAYF